MTEGQLGAPARSSASKGCWIAAAIVAGLLFLGLVGVGVAVYLISQNEDVRRVTRVMGQGMRLMTEAQRAPGTSELRALGCDQAMVIETDRLMSLAGEFMDGGPGQPAADEPRRIVTCQKMSGGLAPSCDVVARTYVTAVPVQPGDFAVVVQVTGQERPLCSARYGSAAQPLGGFDDRAIQNLPQPGQP